MDWQPIETAPKDGNLVLVTGGTHILRSCRRFERGEEDKHKFEFNDVMVARYVDLWLDGRFPWMAARLTPSIDASPNICIEPSHWMPLPEPPK